MADTSESSEIHKSYIEANSKLDHVVLGALVALSAYLAHTNPYSKLGLNPSTLMLISLLLISLSAYFCLRRLHGGVLLLKHNASLFSAFENSDIVGVKAYREQCDKYVLSTYRCYWLRQWTMFLGFAFYVGAKVWIPYVT